MYPRKTIREVRYAALLHDFGKIGVPEAVLLKSNKLSDERLETIFFRIELQKERLRRKAVEQEIELLHHSKESFEQVRRIVRKELEKEIRLLDDYKDWIKVANDPNVRTGGDFEHLKQISTYPFAEVSGDFRLFN